MLGKKAKILLCLSALAIVAAAGLAFLFRFIASEQLENERYERGQTELVVANTTDSPLTLFKAGNSLGEASVVQGFDGDRIWLDAGSYFLKTGGPLPAYYPIHILGYRQGNQDDGSLSITIRKLPASPPVLPPDSGRLLPLPSGEFVFGDRANPGEPHFVWTQAFYIGEFEVTNAEFKLFLDSADGFSDDSNWSDAGRSWRKGNRSEASALLSPADANFGRFGAPDMPVTSVTWYEAAAYCRWLTRRLGGGNWIYSLPTEAEWEKAARGPDGLEYGLSRSLSDAESPLYNWKKNPSAEVTVVGTDGSRQLYKPNRYGLYHMSGNVVEWTQGLSVPFNREKPYSDDEQNRDDRSGARVARGGSWYSASIALLSIAYRDAFLPELRHDDLGFRVVARPIP